jgi:hypothetical protein
MMENRKRIMIIVSITIYYALYYLAIYINNNIPLVYKGLLLFLVIVISYTTALIIDINSNDDINKNRLIILRLVIAVGMVNSVKDKICNVVKRLYHWAWLIMQKISLIICLHYLSIRQTIRQTIRRERRKERRHTHLHTMLLMVLIPTILLLISLLSIVNASCQQSNLYSTINNSSVNILNSNNIKNNLSSTQSTMLTINNYNDAKKIQPLRGGVSSITRCCVVFRDVHFTSTHNFFKQPLHIQSIISTSTMLTIAPHCHTIK